MDRGIAHSAAHPEAGGSTAIGGWLLHRFYQARRRAGRLVGPPVPVGDDVPLPKDDLEAEGILPVVAVEPEPIAVDPPASG